MKPVVYIRKSDLHDVAAQSEIDAAAHYLNVVVNLDEIQKGDLVIGRFSLMPFYKMVEQEIESRGAKLLVSHDDYVYISDMRCWYPALQNMTPRTWFGEGIKDAPQNIDKWFVKGITNSRKHDWNKSAYVDNRDALSMVVGALKNDPLIGNQILAYREFVPLNTYFTDDKGMPITEEYRFFILDGKVLSSGYYWSSHQRFLMDNDIHPDPRNIPSEFVQRVIDRIPLRHYVVDFAITAEGEPIVIELNDPSMSGLCGNSAKNLYRALAKTIG